MGVSDEVRVVETTVRSGQEHFFSFLRIWGQIVDFETASLVLAFPGISYFSNKSDSTFHSRDLGGGSLLLLY